MAEKNISEVSPDVRGLFQKGTEALERRNVDYALTLFQQALQREPSFFDCRKALRAAQFTKAGGSGGTSFFRKVLSGASTSPQMVKAQMALRNSPEEALVAIEQVLNSDPTAPPLTRLSPKPRWRWNCPRPPSCRWRSFTRTRRTTRRW